MATIYERTNDPNQFGAKDQLMVETTQGYVLFTINDYDDNDFNRLASSSAFYLPESELPRLHNQLEGWLLRQHMSPEELHLRMIKHESQAGWVD